jgi:uncharacterized membrane protein YbhN (UPF0104 family)
MKHKLIQSIAPVVALALLVASALVLRQQLRMYHLHDIIMSLSGIPLSRLLIGLGLTALSYALLTGYDTLAMRYIRHRMPYRKIAMASFTSYAMSNTIGFTLVSGVPVRYYFYASWGLPTSQISRLVAFCIMTGWIGLLTLSGSVLALGPDGIPDLLNMPDGLAHPLGIALLALVTAYLVISFFWAKSFHIFKFEVPLPGPGLAISQIVIACLDWITVSAVLYSLLPPLPGLTYPVVLGIFMLGQSLGSISQVPGGLGVFEAVMLMMITGVTGEASTPQILSALVAYRGIYYLLPFVTAGLTFGGHGLWTHGRKLGRPWRATAPKEAPPRLPYDPDRARDFDSTVG